MSINGIGVGLRTPHISSILQHQPAMPWFELLTENWIDASGIDGFLLDQILDRYPVALHGVSLNLGGTDPLDQDYLAALKRLIERCGTDAVSDHLCFSRAAGQSLHDLAPLPYTEEALDHVCHRIQRVQDHLELPIIVENISAYICYPHETIDIASFLNQMSHRTGCGILLDLNNLFVNQTNLGQGANEIIRRIDPSVVSEYHLGGHVQNDQILIDAHNRPVCDQVWDLYSNALEQIGDRPTLIEWDHDLPEWNVLFDQQIHAGRIRSDWLHARSQPNHAFA